MIQCAVMATNIGLITGCSDAYVINLASEHVVVALGEELDTDIKKYVRASKKMLESMTIDLSQVDTDTIGEYKAAVSNGNETKSFVIEVADLTAPEIEVFSNDKYYENSVTLTLDMVVSRVNDASDFDYGFSDDMTKADKDKKMTDTLYFGQLGDYVCEVMAKDEYDNISVSEIHIHIVEEGKIPASSGEITDFSSYMNTNKGQELKAFDSYNTSQVNYGVGNNVSKDTNRPVLSYYTAAYDRYPVDFIQPESDFVWLTFNEISEKGTTHAILDTLKEKNVSAVFFVTLSYVKNNPDIIQRMIDEGHVLGNYTASCTNVTGLTANQLTSELNTLYNHVYDTYGYEMYLFRTPSGQFTEQSLAVAQSLGYRTVFWSFAYADWDANNQWTVTDALANALDKAHGGAIYLLSGASETNKSMLGDMIDGIRDKGLEFASYQKN